ncbi:MAG: class I SAM-dependent methyltransferase [Bacteriovoracia bacterium]
MIFPREIQKGVDISGHYDDLDRYYRELWGEHLHHGLWLNGEETVEEAVVQMLEKVASAVDVRAGDRVCDVGCGYGGTSRFLTQRHGAEVIGLSLSSAQLDYARARGRDAGLGDSPRYLLQDWLQNSFPDENFDIVLSIESSEHMEDKPRFFSEAYRTLKPGGRMAVCAWLATERPARWEVRHLLEPICREGRLPSMGSEAEYREFFARARFKNVRFEELSSQVKKTWPICAWRLTKGLVTRPDLRRFLRTSPSADRAFAKTVFRLWLAYETRSMRYGIFTATK